MPRTSFATYMADLATKYQREFVSKTSLNTVQGRLFSLWGSAPNAGATPSVAAVPTRATAGAIGQQNPAANPLRIGKIDLSWQSATNANAGGMAILCDRLSHQGGLSGTTTGAQTANLPTSALTRSTSGVGVYAGLEIYSAVGATGVDATISYTNQAGTSGQVCSASNFGGSGYNTAQRFIWMPLVGSDTGVKAVASVTLSASTGTPGNFGVTLFKPVLWLPYTAATPMQFTYAPIHNLGAEFPDAPTDSCLFWLVLPGSTNSGSFAAEILFLED